MEDTNGVRNSNGNGSYIEWLEANWESFGPSEVSEQEPAFFMPYPVVGHLAWPIRTTHSYIQGWIRGLKLGLVMTGGIIALMGATTALGWFVNLGQTGFAP